jgi:hypothetical protein
MLTRVLSGHGPGLLQLLTTLWPAVAPIALSPRLRPSPPPSLVGFLRRFVPRYPAVWKLHFCCLARTMKYSAADPSVRPHEQLGLIVPWTVFNLLACAWFAALFVGLLVGPPARRNPTLLSLYAVFVIATLSGSALSWTGHVMTAEVPMPLCIVSGAFGSSTTLAQVSAAFAMVFKVRWFMYFSQSRADV